MTIKSDSNDSNDSNESNNNPTEASIENPSTPSGSDAPVETATGDDKPTEHDSVESSVSVEPSTPAHQTDTASIQGDADAEPKVAQKQATTAQGSKDSPQTQSGQAQPHWAQAWVYPLNAFLLAAAGISLYSASTDSPAVGWLALMIGILMAVPFGLSAANPHNIFTPHLARINKIALIVLALLPIWQMNSFLLEGTEIPIIQHLVSLSLILALCCLVMVLDKHERDFDKQTLIQHLALRAVDNASWVYSFSLGIVFALLTCLIIRVLLPDSVFDIKLLSRGLIPPVTLVLFYAGLTDLTLRFWQVFSQSRDDSSALSLLLQRLKIAKREVILDAIYTGMDRSGELNRYLVWAIPILGFIGTVLGISLAAQGMGSMLSSASQEYSEVLTKALEPLGVAFDTTLIALTLALMLALAQSLHSTWQDRRVGHLIDLYSQKKQRRNSNH